MRTVSTMESIVAQSSNVSGKMVLADMVCFDGAGVFVCVCAYEFSF